MTNVKKDILKMLEKHPKLIISGTYLPSVLALAAEGKIKQVFENGKIIITKK